MTKNERDNLEFRITFCETNLRYLVSDSPRNEVLIEETKQEIAWCKQQIANGKIDLDSRPKYTILKVV